MRTGAEVGAGCRLARHRFQDEVLHESNENVEGRRAGETLAHAKALPKAEERVLLCVDKAPVLVDEPLRAEDFGVAPQLLALEHCVQVERDRDALRSKKKG